MSGIEAIIENAVRKAISERSYEATQGMHTIIDLPEVRVIEASNADAQSQLSQSPYEVGDDRTMDADAYIISKSDGTRNAVANIGNSFKLFTTGVGNKPNYTPNANILLGLMAYVIWYAENVAFIEPRSLKYTFEKFPAISMTPAYMYAIENSYSSVAESIFFMENASPEVLAAAYDRIASVPNRITPDILAKALEEISNPEILKDAMSKMEEGTPEAMNAVELLRKQATLHRLVLNPRVKMSLLAKIAKIASNERTFIAMLDRVNKLPSFDMDAYKVIAGLVRNNSFKNLDPDIIMDYAQKMKFAQYRKELLSLSPTPGQV